jgi:hypothetical protein
MAYSVMFVDMVIGPVYLGDDVVGVEPLVV